MKITEISTADLVPYARNARTHSDEQISQIAASIKRFGWTNPILIKPDKTVIAGHARLAAAQKLGIEKAPCIVLKDLSDEQCRALVLADNKLAMNAGWNLDLLSSELTELKELNFDLDVIGFSDDELNSLIKAVVRPDDFGQDFSLPSGEKSGFQQMSFILADKQAELIKEAVSLAKENITETFGNENSNGNALYEVVRQWAELKKLN